MAMRQEQRDVSPRLRLLPAESEPLNRERVALEHRLDDGYRRIEAARLEGVDVQAWEEFWIQLLREYEQVSDEVSRLAA